MEEENDRGEEAYKGEEEYPEVNGEESGKTVKERIEVEKNKKKLNEKNEGEAGETQNVDQAEEEELTHLNGKNSEGNGEGMERLNYQGDLQPEEEIKEDSGSQNQGLFFQIFFLMFLYLIHLSLMLLILSLSS